MRDFFKSKNFKVLMILLVMLFTFFLRAVYVGAFMPFVSGLGGIIMAPVGKLTAAVSGAVGEAVSPFVNASQLKKENEELREENLRLTQQMIDYENLKIENDQFREFLEIKERNEDFVFEPAIVVGRSPDEQFGEFVIDVGSFHGVSPRNAVITPDGLVGIVTEVSYGYSKVSTILDISMDVGVMDIRTLDTGVATGTVALAKEKRLKLGYISRDSGVATGDIIVTSGISGLLPKGLVIGKVESVRGEANGLSYYAVIEPAADVYGTKNVLVIKDFAGKDASLANE